MNEPTIEEFITIKHKVIGAGIFGKWVWATSGALIVIIAAARREIFAWFQNYNCTVCLKHHRQIGTIPSKGRFS